MEINERFIDQAELLETAENLNGNHNWIRELIKYGVELQNDTNYGYRDALLYRMLEKFFNRNRGEVVCIQQDFPGYYLGIMQSALEAVFKDAQHVRHEEFDSKIDTADQGYFSLRTDWNKTELALKMSTDEWITPDGIKLLTRYQLYQIHQLDRHPITVLRIFAIPEHIHRAEEVAAQIKDWLKQNNFLHGKKITSHCEFLSLERHYTWDNVVLEPAIKQEIIDNVVDFIKYIPIYQANNIPTKRGLIFYGSPGVGKTLVGKVLASAVDCTFIRVTAAKIKDPESITRLFQLARELHPSIIFVEDLDCFGKDRHIHFTPVLGELLNQMDGIVENEGVIVIATTNDLEAIEPALKDRPSRFDRVLEFKLPNPELRKKIIAQALLGKTANGINIDLIAEKTEGYTGAHLQELVILATKVAIEKKDYDESNIVKLTDTHFETALTQMQKKKEKLLGF
jgi:hypothetical protein